TTTTAASALASMSSAPMAATVIRVSMVKGEPLRAAERARLAMGTRPTRTAAIKPQGCKAGTNCSAIKARASAMAQASVRRALAPCHHAGSAGRDALGEGAAAGEVL